MSFTLYRLKGILRCIKHSSLRLFAFIDSTLLFGAAIAAKDIVIVDGGGVDFLEDLGCVNRSHSDIPMAAIVEPGQNILFSGRDARSEFTG